LQRGGNQTGLLTSTIKDKSALYLAWIAFVQNGGLLDRHHTTAFEACGSRTANRFAISF
jgi:Tfp pilus assembly protein PilZ